MNAAVLFSKMKRHADHFAVVLDEYGGMCGIITVTDLVEQLVGDFDEDENEKRQEPEIERLDSKSWKIVGTCSLHEVSRALNRPFPEEKYETLNGYLIGALGEIPKDGSRLKMELDGLQVQILGVQQHCIEKAILRLS